MARMKVKQNYKVPWPRAHWLLHLDDADVCFFQMKGL